MTRAKGPLARRRDRPRALPERSPPLPFGVAVVLSDGWRVVVSIHASMIEADIARDRVTLSASGPVLFSVVHRFQGYSVGDSWDGGPL